MPDSLLLVDNFLNHRAENAWLHAAEYAPSELLCPETYQWVRIDAAAPVPCERCYLVALTNDRGLTWHGLAPVDRRRRFTGLPAGAEVYAYTIPPQLPPR